MFEAVWSIWVRSNTGYYITFKWVSMHYLCNGQFNLSFWHWVENNLWPHTWFFSKFFHIAPIFSNVPITFKNLNFSNNWLLVYVVFFVCKNSFWESFYRSSFHKFSGEKRPFEYPLYKETSNGMIIKGYVRETNVQL